MFSATIRFLNTPEFPHIYMGGYYKYQIAAITDMNALPLQFPRCCFYRYQEVPFKIPT